MKRFFLIILFPFLIAACGNNAEPEATDGTEAVAEDTARNTEVVTQKASGLQEVTINLYTVGETMQTMTFEPGRLQVSPGAEVTLILMNKAKSEAMIHNAVIIEPGKQNEVVEAALEAGPDNEYVPEGNPYIIAATGLADPGETVEVTFTAPEETGTYQYICTYPGHTAMKGVLLVK